MINAQLKRFRKFKNEIKPFNHWFGNRLSHTDSPMNTVSVVAYRTDIEQSENVLQDQVFDNAERTVYFKVNDNTIGMRTYRIETSVTLDNGEKYIDKFYLDVV